MDDWTSPAEISPAPCDAWPTPERAVRARDRGARLADILKRELLPRLIEARPPARVRAGRAVAPADPEALARCLVAGRTASARAAIERRLESGASAQAVMFEDIVPAARRLGDFWRDDSCDFADVTIAAGALRGLLRDLNSDGFAARSVHAPSLLIMTAPGETHELGADIVAEVFRRAGWRSRRCGFEDGRAALRRERFDVAGFSLSCERYADALRRAIVEARDVSRNRRLAILVGGPVFASSPGFSTRLGADVSASAKDVSPRFPSTVQQALRL